MLVNNRYNTWKRFPLYDPVSPSVPVRCFALRMWMQGGKEAYVTSTTTIVCAHTDAGMEESEIIESDETMSHPCVSIRPMGVTRH